MEVQENSILFTHFTSFTIKCTLWFFRKKDVYRIWLTTFLFFFSYPRSSNVQNTTLFIYHISCCGFAFYLILQDKLNCVTSIQTLLSKNSGFVNLQRLQRLPLERRHLDGRYPVLLGVVVPKPTEGPWHTVDISLGTKHWAECSMHICHLIQPSNYPLRQELSSSLCKDTSLEQSRSLHGVSQEVVELGSKLRCERNPQPLFSSFHSIFIIFFKCQTTSNYLLHRLM